MKGSDYKDLRIAKRVAIISIVKSNSWFLIPV